MSSIKEHIDVLFEELKKIHNDGHTTEPNEFVTFSDLDQAVKNFKKACEQTKDLEKE